MVHLTDCEQEVMKCVWDAEEDISMMQIVDIVKEKYGKEWKPQTISTFLARLVKKEYLEMTRRGRIFYYHEKIEYSKYVQELSQDYLKFWLEGDVSQFVDAIKQGRGLTKSEVESIKGLIS